MEPYRRSSTRSVLSAATLAAAPAEVLDFILPLWAGSALDVGVAVVGALVATEALLSLLVRPLAGELADRFDRRRVAAVGAAVYAVSFAGYALAGHTAAMAFAAAAAGGVGGALFWVGVRAWTGDQAGGDTGAFGKLLAAEGRGALAGYVVTFMLLGETGYPVVFWLGCASCALAAALLAYAAATPAGARAVSAVELSGRGAFGGGALPLLSVAGLTAAAESGLWVLLTLRLQEEFRMAPVEIALVFAPGLLVFVFVPEHAHRVTDRLGRTRSMVIGLIASAAFAAGLAVASTPAAVSVVWALVAVFLAAVVPVEQATIALASGGRIGRGMGRYETARLAGVLVGSPALGLVYENVGWAFACGAAAVAALAGAAVIPAVLRALDLPSAPPAPQGAANEAAPADVPAERPASGRAPGEHAGEEAGEKAEPAPKKPRLSPAEKARKERRGWGVHTALFVVGQLALWPLDASWPLAMLIEGGVPEGGESGLMTASRIWVIVYVIDTLVSWSYTVFPARKAE